MVSNPFSGLKEAGLERMAQQVTPSEIPHARIGVSILSTIEADQADALNEACDAAGLDYRLDPNPQARQAQLLDMADSLADGSFRSWWFDNVAPSIMDNAGHAEAYAGLDADQWRDTLRQWHDQAHDQGLVDEPADQAAPAEVGASASRVVESRFSVTLREFVVRVVNWDQGREMRALVAGPVERNSRIIRDLAARIEEQQARIEELTKATPTDEIGGLNE